MQPKKIIALFVAASITCSHFAYASLGDSLSGMFQSASTNPQDFSTKTRSGVFLGALSLKVPAKNYQLINFDPPRYNMGCGGIDLHMGSFSFINAEQFKQMLRNIASSAAGYFFKMAIHDLCPVCDNVMSSLEAAARFVNQSNINSCKVGQKIGSALYEDMGNLLNESKVEEAKTAGVAAGYKSDFATAWDEFKNNLPTSLLETREQRLKKGNKNWHKIVATNAGDKIGIGTLSDSQMNEYLLSIMGGWIYPDEADGGVSSPVVADGGSPSTKARPLPSLFGIKEFLEGNPSQDTSIRYYKCSNPSDESACDNPTLEKMPFRGIAKEVHRLLFGDYDAEIATANSIIGKMSGGKFDTLDASQVQFLTSIRQRFLGAALEFQGVEGSAAGLAIIAEPFIVKDMRYMTAKAILDAIKTSMTASSRAEDDTLGFQYDESDKARLTELSKEVSELVPSSEDVLNWQKAMLVYLQGMRAMAPSNAFVAFNK